MLGLVSTEKITSVSGLQNLTPPRNIAWKSVEKRGIHDQGSPLKGSYVKPVGVEKRGKAWKLRGMAPFSKGSTLDSGASAWVACHDLASTA